MPIKRRRFVTKKNGETVEITSQEQLQAIIDEMTPEEKAEFDAQYRFVPITGELLGPIDGWYSGILRDLD